MSASIEAPPQAPVLVTVTSAMRSFGLGRSTIYELIFAGKLEARKHGNKWLIVYDSLISWANSLETANA